MARSRTGEPFSLTDYFRFSRSQRRAMLLMLALTFGIYLLLQAIKQKERASPAEAEIAAGKLESLKTGQLKDWAAAPAPGKASPASRKQRGALQPAALAVRPAFFDPNTASEQTLAALGLKRGAISNILNYRQKGGRFRKPEDLSKIYALKPQEVQALIPYVRIEAAEQPKQLSEAAPNPSASARENYPSKAKPVALTININRSDSLDWQLLPGIGARRAAAITRYREKLGGFTSIDQVAETYGLPDSVFQQIKASLTLQPGQINQLSLNRATEAELKAHPYIGWQWAKLIVAYRSQHGAFESVDDLMKIHIMKKEWLDRVRPYLKAD